MTETEALIERIKTVIDMSEHKEVKALAKLFLAYVRQQQDSVKPPLGFGADKGRNSVES